MLTTAARTFAGSSPRRALNFCDSSEQTLVSSEGTTMSSAARLPSSKRTSRLSEVKSPAVNSNCGAGLPASSSGPSSVIGFPLKVTAPARDCTESTVMEHLPKASSNSSCQHIFEAIGVARHDDLHCDALADRDVAPPAIGGVRREARPRRARDAQRDVVADELLRRTGGDDALKRKGADYSRASTR